MSETLPPEVKTAIENIWDHRNIHLGDTRIPCDGEVIKNYIDGLEAKIEHLQNIIKNGYDAK